jgi:DNA-binding MarR family transcriptional regulator
MDHREIDRIAKELLAVIPQLYRLMTTEARREDHGHASIPQLRLLAELLPGPQSMSALARLQHVSAQAVHDLVHDMLERGWLSRVPHDHDRRQQLLCITEAGQIALTEGREQAIRQFAPHLQSLTETELYVLAAALPALQRVLIHGEQSGADGKRPRRKHADDS